MAGLGVEHIPLRFLDFPTEIRDQIYGELLLAEKRFSKSCNRYRCRPNILRVNRQIYAEAFEILYKANQLIYIQEEQCSLKQALVQLCIPFMPLQGSRYFYYDPAMVLTLRCPATPTQTPKKRFQWSYLIAADRFEEVCLAISIAKMIKPKRGARKYAQISISFHKQCRDITCLQNKLCHSLRYLPPFEQANVTGLNPAPLRLTIIQDLTIMPSLKQNNPEAVLKSARLEGDLCLRATKASGPNARGNLTLNGNLAIIRYNHALRLTIAFLDQASAAVPKLSDIDLVLTSPIVNDHLMPLVCKIASTAENYNVKDVEGLASLGLLVSLLRSPHLPSDGNAKIFTTIAGITRGRGDYSLSLYALLQAQEHLPQDGLEELKKPAVRLWKSIVKGDDDENRRVYLRLLHNRFAPYLLDLELPNEYQGQEIKGENDTPASMGDLEMKLMREAEGRLMGLGVSKE
ncbi:MAG: hypothetical protein Q9169_002230 [Polycauliona sp. 2 TL-2023]